MFDPKKRRGDFPILSRKVNGQPLTYLDSAATAQKPEVVLKAMDGFYRQHYANPHRGLHALSAKATELYEQGRLTVGNHFGVPAPNVVFTRSATEAINLFVQGWLAPRLRQGTAVIVLTEMEHHANLVPWFLLAKRHDLKFRFVKMTPAGQLDMSDYRKQVEGATAVGITMASNVLGTINPLADLVKVAHTAGAKVLVDAAQGAPHLAIDFAQLGADAMAVTGHKMLGPTGIGALLATDEVFGQMQPVYGGGEMIKRVGWGEYEPADAPWRFEAGTMPAAEVIGWSAALAYLENLGMEHVRQHEIDLNTHALARLGEIPGLTLLGPSAPGERVGLIAFTVDGIHPHDLATLLDEDGIAVRSGHHCAQPLHDRLGIPASTRASWSVFTTPEDIDRLAESITRAQKVFAA